MAIVGYARVSTADQSLDVQLQQLQDAGCKPIFQEKKTGTNTDRPELAACMNYLRDGDTLIVTRLDRLARSMPDLFAILGELDRKEATFRCLLQPEIDTTTTNGRLLTGILAAIAQFETEIRRDRQREGIEAAKAKGVYSRNGPRNARLTAASVMLRKGCSYTEAAHRTGISESTLRRRIPGFGKRPPHLTHPPSAVETVEVQPMEKPLAPRGGFFGRFGRA